jgi:hypothetical protein
MASRCGRAGGRVSRRACAGAGRRPVCSPGATPPVPAVPHQSTLCPPSHPVASSSPGRASGSAGFALAFPTSSCAPVAARRPQDVQPLAEPREEARRDAVPSRDLRHSREQPVDPAHVGLRTGLVAPPPPLSLSHPQPSFDAVASSRSSSTRSSMVTLVAPGSRSSGRRKTARSRRYA